MFWLITLNIFILKKKESQPLIALGLAQSYGFMIEEWQNKIKEKSWLPILLHVWRDICSPPSITHSKWYASNQNPFFSGLYIISFLESFENIVTWLRASSLATNRILTRCICVSPNVFKSKIKLALRIFANFFTNCICLIKTIFACARLAIGQAG